GLAHTEGWGMPKDLEQGALLLRRACENHEVMGCASYGQLLLRGAPGVIARQPNQALAMLASACNSGSFNACYGVGLALSRGHAGEPRAAEAVPYLRYACGYKLPEACDELAMLLDSGR